MYLIVISSTTGHYKVIIHDYNLTPLKISPKHFNGHKVVTFA